MKSHYTSVEDYIHDIYDKLYPRAKVAADLLIRKRVVNKFDFEKTSVPVSQVPRAIRDLKGHGIPIISLERINVPQSKSKVSQYALGDAKDIEANQKYGRQYNPSGMKRRLARLHGSVCVFCGKHLEPKERELDHKLPIEIFGELSPAERLNPDNYQLVCRNCNRLKREATSHGAFDDKQDGIDAVKSNYWYDPTQYRKNKDDGLYNQSIVVWKNNADVQTYSQIKRYSKENNQDFQDTLKSIVNLGLKALKTK